MTLFRKKLYKTLQKKSVSLVKRVRNEGHTAFVEMRLVLLLAGLQIDREQQLASVRVQVDRQGDFVLAEFRLIFPVQRERERETV